MFKFSGCPCFSPQSGSIIETLEGIAKKGICFMSDLAERVFVTVDVVVPRLSPSGSGWEVLLIQRKREPHKGLWALPGGHLTTDDLSLETAAQREVREETGLDIPLHLFRQVQMYEDFEDSRGKYVCLLYVLFKPLASDVKIEAGDDAAYVQWYPVENLDALPYLAFNHIRLLTMALRQLFTTNYYDAEGIQEVEICRCEIEKSPGSRCTNTAYWRYSGVVVCPMHVKMMVSKQ
jgi:8-oxo-dGTP diphosphatase